MFKKSLMLMIVLLSIKTFAIDLQVAKSQGLVGEKSNGYLGVVSQQAPKDVKMLVASVNRKRLQLYRGIAAKNKISPPQVAELAGEKAIQKTTPGNYVNNGQGWVRK